MNRVNRFTALALAATLGAGIVTAPIAAHASEEGKRNTALALGAVSLGLLLTQKNALPGIITGAGAVYAYKKYDDDVRSRHRREREYGYDDYRYRQNQDRYNRNDNYPEDSYRRNRYNDNSSDYRYNDDNSDYRYRENDNRSRRDNYNDNNDRRSDFHRSKRNNRNW